MILQNLFYDKIDLSKGPSLGTNFSLACPYTLLAHYHELDFAMTYDVQPNLIRFAIGLEDLDVMKEKFEVAFKESRLHPKLPKTVAKVVEQKRGYCTVSNASASCSSLSRGRDGIIGRQRSIHSAYTYHGGLSSIGFDAKNTPFVPKSTRSFATGPRVQNTDAQQLDFRCLCAVVGKETIRKNSLLIGRAATSILRRRF